MSIELRQLRYFVAVVEEGQMTRAAEKLYLAQAALSQAIAQLEHQTGVKLLERHARGVTPTAAGKVLLEKAKVTLVAAADLDATARAWANGQADAIVVGALPMTLAVIAPLASEMRRQHPSLDVSLRQLDFTSQRKELSAGRIDIEIAIPPPQDDEFDVVVIGSIGRVVLLPVSHRFARQRELSFDMVSDEVYWGRHPSIPEDWMDAHWLTQQRRKRPRVTREQPRTPEEVWLLVAAGKAISVGPAFVARWAAFPGVVAIPLRDVDPLVIGLARRRDDDRPAVRAAVDVARTLSASAGGRMLAALLCPDRADLTANRGRVPTPRQSRSDSATMD